MPPKKGGNASNQGSRSVDSITAPKAKATKKAPIAVMTQWIERAAWRCASRPALSTTLSGSLIRRKKMRKERRKSGWRLQRKRSLHLRPLQLQRRLQNLLPPCVSNLRPLQLHHAWLQLQLTPKSEQLLKAWCVT